MTGGGGAKAPVGRSFYCVVDLGKAYSIVGVTIVRQYLVNEKGSCNGCDQTASPTPHRASDLSDTSVPLARQEDAPSWALTRCCRSYPGDAAPHHPLAHPTHYLSN